MNRPLPRLGIVILNYNTRELLRQCLQSVYRAVEHSADRLHVDVLVIDSASNDDSAEMVRTAFPATALIASRTNLGYTGGNNRGLTHFGFQLVSIRKSLFPLGHNRFSDRFLGNDTAATEANHAARSTQQPPADYILFLNADTDVAPDALWQMAQCLETHPNAGACGAHLRYGDGTFQHGAFTYPSLAQIAIDFLPLAGIPGIHRLLNSRLNGRYPQALWQGRAPFAVDFVLGAALMVRGDVIDEIGGLDDGYFMYCEELDWAVRMKLAGWQCYAVPTAHVTHHEGQSSKQVRWSAFVRLWRSRLRFYRKYQGRHPIGYFTAVRLLVALGMVWKRWQVDRRFALGQVDGVAWQEEREAYEEVLNIIHLML